MKKLLLLTLLVTSLSAHEHEIDKKTLQIERLKGANMFLMAHQGKKTGSTIGHVAQEIKDIGKLVSFDTLWGLTVLAVAVCGTSHYIFNWSPMEPLAKRAGKVILIQSVEAGKGMVKGLAEGAKEVSLEALGSIKEVAIQPEAQVTAATGLAGIALYKYLSVPVGLMAKLAHLRHPGARNGR